MVLFNHFIPYVISRSVWLCFLLIMYCIYYLFACLINFGLSVRCCKFLKNWGCWVLNIYPKNIFEFCSWMGSSYSWNSLIFSVLDLTLCLNQNGSLHNWSKTLLRSYLTFHELWDILFWLVERGMVHGPVWGLVIASSNPSRWFLFWALVVTSYAWIFIWQLEGNLLHMSRALSLCSFLSLGILSCKQTLAIFASPSTSTHSHIHPIFQGCSEVARLCTSARKFWPGSKLEQSWGSPLNVISIENHSFAVWYPKSWKLIFHILSIVF